VSAVSQATELDVQLYQQMALIRCFEEAAYRAYEAGEVAGTIHASIGQEAIAAGVISALEPADKVLSHHRGHGHALAKGVDAGALMAELLGRQAGASHAKGGSMHVTDAQRGFLGSYAIVGGSSPLAVGAALAQKTLKTGAVCVVFFGDGAINQGVLYEGFNLSGIWGLPVLFVCENNSFAISTRAEASTSGPGIVPRARAFGLRAEGVDGQDAQAVREIALELVAGARAASPAVLECTTYRYMGHSRGDPPHGLYRTDEELKRWHDRDPLRVLAANAGMTEEQVQSLDTDARSRVEEALAFARASPVPPPEWTLQDVWGDQ
jgi:TPP-dependent pyruvate/acetoin dehydrogenase alpha subunit